VLSLLLNTPALAATYTIEADGSGSVASLADAAALAAPGDVFVLGDGKFLGATFTTNVTVRGRNGSAFTVIDGQGYSPLVGQNGLTVQGITLTSAGATALYIEGGGDLTDVVVADSGYWGTSNGGGAALVNGTYTVERSRFENNQAYLGGGLFVYGVGSSLSLSDVEFISNSAVYGGGVMIDSSVSASQANVVYTANSAYYHGGAFYGGYLNTVVSSGITYTGNSAPYGWGGSVFCGYCSYDAADEVHAGNSGQYGGALAFYNSTVTLARGQYDGNTASADAGATHLYGSTGTEAEAVYTGNVTTGGNGGAVHANYGSFIFTNPTFDGNHADALDGGALSLTNYADCDIEGGVFSENEALNNGGGFFAGSYSNLTLSGTTLDANSAGYGGGGYAEGGSVLTTTDPTWSNNYASQAGGGLYAYYYAMVSETGATYTDNTSYGAGGSLFTYYGVTLRESHCTLADGTSIYSSGGHVYAYYYGTAEFTDCSFSTGLAYYDAGALFAYALYDGPFVLLNSSLTGNTSIYGSGGGALIAYSLSNNLEDVSVIDNSAYNVGGGLYMYGQGSTTIDRTTIQYNSATYSGGGIQWDAQLQSRADFVMRDSVVSDNAASASGGGAYVAWADQLDVQSSTFAGNVAGEEAFGGGLIARNTTGSLSVTNSVFQSNFAGHGGGVYVDGVQGFDVPSDWQNNVFATNQAAIGGGLCLVYGRSHELVNNTLVGNSASKAGGGLCVAEAGVRLDNTVVAYTAAGAALHPYDAESAAALTFTHGNLYGNASGDVGGELSTAPSSLAAEPGFAGWWDDGRDNDSFVLTSQSPMRDAGNPKLLDPDGTRSDIGAYGGPGLVVVDADGDGHGTDTDCDDDDPTVFPGAPDAWYDEVDSDCAGNDDYDQDGDGSTLEDDCDDTDPALVGPCDTTGEADSGDTSGDYTSTVDGAGTDPGCGCASGASAPGAGLVALTAVAVRRRRATR
jgi:hypothetical protein